MNKIRAFLICVLFLTVAFAPLLPVGGTTGSRVEITTFNGGQASKTISFAGAGSDNTVSILIAKKAQASKAVLNVSWDSVTNENVITHTSTADFSTGTPAHVNLTNNDVKLAIDRFDHYLLDPTYNNTGVKTQPYGVAVGDLNGDGLTDIVVALNVANSIGIFYQNNNRDFNAIVTILVGTAPYDVAVGDLNRDGRADIVVTNQNSNNITVIEQNAQGKLNATQNYATAANCQPRGVAIGNLDNKTGNDVGVACGAQQTINIFYQQVSSLLLTPPTSYSIGAFWGRGIAIGDVNSDGLADAVVAGYSVVGMFYTGNLIVFNQTGAGTLAAGVFYTLTGPSFDVKVGDLNGDKKNDVAVSSDLVTVNGGGLPTVKGKLEVFYQQNDKSLGKKVVKTNKNAGNGVDVGDISADGLKDVAQADGIPAGLTQGGAFGSNLAVYYQDNQSNLKDDKAMPAQGNIFDVAIGDLNHDGFNDVVATNSGANTIGIYRQAFQPILFTQGTLTSTAFPANGDLVGFNATWNATVDQNGTVNIDVSNNGGLSWTSGVNKTTVQFPGHGSVLEYRVTLNSLNNTTTPVLHDLTIHYTFQHNPADQTVNIGSTGTNDWSKVGNFTGTETLKDFSAKLNAFVAQATPDGNGMVTVPIKVTSSNIGKVTLSGLDIVYSTNTPPEKPVLMAPANGIWTNSTPLFQLSSTDVDTKDVLKYTIQISNDNFTTIYKEFNMTSSFLGWRNIPFHTGIVANFTPVTPLADGRYQWKAKAFDGTAWSQPSAQSYFGVDTHPPTGTVTDDGVKQTDHTKLHALFQFTDSLSGVVDYQYSIGKAPGHGDIVVAKETTASDVTETGLALKDGNYYFTVRAKDAAGLWCQNVSSDGIMIYTEGKGGNAIPSVLISQPVDGATVSGNVTIKGEAMDLDVADVLKAFVRIDNGPWSNATGGPDWNLLWDTTQYTNAQHTISAMASDGKDNSSVVSINVKVNNIHNLLIVSYVPKTDPTITETGSLDLSVVAVDNMLHPLTYVWSLDGKAQAGSSSTFKYVTGYTDSGSHTIKVVVSGPAQTCGLSAEHQWTVTVLNKDRAPAGAIMLPKDGAGLKTGDNVKFQATGSDPDNQTVSFKWDFGDGQQLDGQNVVHKYSKTGMFTVTMTVSDGSLSYNTSITVKVTKRETSNLGMASLMWPLIIIIIIVAIIVALVMVMRRKKKAAAQPAQPGPQPMGQPTQPTAPPPPPGA